MGLVVKDDKNISEEEFLVSVFLINCMKKNTVIWLRFEVHPVNTAVIYFGADDQFLGSISVFVILC